METKQKLTAVDCEMAVLQRMDAIATLRAMQPQLNMAETLEELVYKKGRAFRRREPVPLGFPVTPRSRECYFNAWMLYRSMMFRNDPAMRYCEGYVMADSLIMPVLHGWVWHSGADAVFDPSIEEEGAAFYYGVVFSRTFTLTAWSALRRRELIGILGNAWQMPDAFAQSAYGDGIETHHLRGEAPCNRSQIAGRRSAGATRS